MGASPAARLNDRHAHQILSNPRRVAGLGHIMKPLSSVVLFGCTCFVSAYACGGGGPSGPGVVQTSEACKTEADCKTAPSDFCKDEKTLVISGAPSCFRSKCQWPQVEEPCGYMCTGDYCVSAQ